jgi:putative hydrolase of the HAD superfamily
MEGFIFDLDHTLYSLAFANEGMFVRASIEASLEAALLRGIAFEREEAERLLRRAPEWDRADMQTLIRERGFDEELLFEIFNRHAFGNVSPAIAQGRDPRLAAALAPYKGRAVIVTHASRYWAERAVELLGLQDIFPPGRILALDDPAIAFRGKHQSEVPFREALKILGLPPESVAMVEDTSKNLVIPHAMGITTVLLTWGKPVAPADHPHVDRFHDTAVDFLRSLPPPAPAPAPGPRPSFPP